MKKTMIILLVFLGLSSLYNDVFASEYKITSDYQIISIANGHRRNDMLGKLQSGINPMIDSHPSNTFNSRILMSNISIIKESNYEFLVLCPSGLPFSIKTTPENLIHITRNSLVVVKHPFIPETYRFIDVERIIVPLDKRDNQ